MNYKKMLVLVGILLVVAVALIACGAPMPDEAPQSENSVPVLKTAYYLADGQYGIAFFNDPVTNKRCVVTFNNGAGTSVNGASAIPFCYDQ